MKKRSCSLRFFFGGRLLELHQLALVPARTSVVVEVDASPGKESACPEKPFGLFLSENKDSVEWPRHRERDFQHTLRS